MKYGFLGCGNMGGAIARAVAKTTNDILITDRSGKAQSLADELNIKYTSSHIVAAECERIFLAVKPQMMADALYPICDILKQRKPILITMAAGLTMRTISDIIGEPIPIIRIMPNTPVSIGMGMTVYCYNELVSDTILNDFICDMSAAGRMDHLPEQLIDAASALSGSGPAYLYMFIEAMADGAVLCGIPKAKALEYAATTIVGSAQLMLESGQHPAILKDAVCSPGGSTIAGLQILENHSFRGAVMECISAAYHKNQELGHK